MDKLWTQITPSDYAWEQEGLDFLRRQLPDHEPYRVWANFEQHIMALALPEGGVTAPTGRTGSRGCRG
jgi:hypothetical protein